jgi:glycosyltransferase involved in cell wall biosynthesis
VRVFFSNHSTAPVNLGGAERSLLRLVEDWLERRPDLEPVFLTKAPQGQFIKALKERGWPFKAYRFRGWAVPSPQPAPASEVAAFATVDYAAVSAMTELMRAQKPDLVVTNTLVAPWAAFAAASLGIPHVWFVREFGDLDHGLNFQIGRESTFHDIGLLSGAVVANSHAVKAHLAQYMEPDKISVAYPQVDLAAVRARASEEPTTRPFPQASPGLKVTVVGRVEPGKGQHRVIDALGVLAARGTHASLCIVGSWKSPGYDVELRDRARAAGLDGRVTIVGEQENPFPFIDAADVCVTPSTIEAFGRTTLEYMAVGKAVVASESGGSAELVVPGTTGSLFDPSDVESLAHALEAYAMDPASAVAHGAAGSDRIDVVLTGDHSNDAVIDRLEALIGQPGYQLPHVAQYWFALPAAFASVEAMTAKMALGLLASRVRTRTGMVGRVLRRPGAAARRLRGR